MEIDGNQAVFKNEDKTYRDYLYSIVSIEVVKYHTDFYYLLCGADSGYLYTFCFNPELLTEKLQVQDREDENMNMDPSKDMIYNMRSIALGISPIYLFPMKTHDSSEDVSFSKLIFRK